MTYNLIESRHTGDLRQLLQTSLHRAGKMCNVNMYRLFCKRKTTFCNNSSKLATTF